MVTPKDSGGGLAAGFSRFWWGEAVSGFGSAVTALALQTLVVVTLQGSAVEVGWLNSARWLPYLVLGLVVGALVDRARRRPTMMATDLARAVLLALIPLAWALDFLAFPLLLVLVVLFGTASLINDAASMSFLPRLVSRVHLQRAHARLDGAAYEQMMAPPVPRRLPTAVLSVAPVRAPTPPTASIGFRRRSADHGCCRADGHGIGGRCCPGRWAVLPRLGDGAWQLP
jgi:hypothetical protein